MELRHLRYFVAVAEELHFGRAAERLHIAQPALSQQIRQLEAELGTQLLARTTRQVALTPAGARYLERAHAILADVDRAGAEALRVAAGEVGRVAIGFIGSATYSLLPSIARGLREEFTGIKFDMRGEMLTPDQEAALRDGTIDIGVLRTPVSDPEIEVEVLRRESLVVALPAGHRLAAGDAVRIKDLKGEPFISYPDGHRSVLHDTVLTLCSRAGFTPRKVAQVAETSTMVVFVAAGLGLAVLPESVTGLQLRGVEFRPVADPVSVDLAVGWRPDRITPAADLVLSHLRRHFGDGGPAAEEQR